MSLDASRRVIMIGPLPPPWNGQNVAFSNAIEFFKEQKHPYVLLNIAERSSQNRATGDFAWRRFLEIIRVFGQYLMLVYLPKQTVYLTITQTRIGFFRDFIFIWPARFLRHRIVLHLFGGGYRQFFDEQPHLFRRLITWTLSAPDCLIVEGEYLKAQLNFLPDTHKIQVVHNSSSSQPPKRYQRHVHDTNQPFRVLYLSNLIETKGYWDVLEAIRLLRIKGLNVYGDFCGEFRKHSDVVAYPDPKKAKARFLDILSDPLLNGYVTYHGVVEGQKKDRILYGAHVFVLPSFYRNEGQPVSIVEAIANGLPVIATRYRGIPEMVRDGYNGFLVPPRNPAEISERIERLYSSSDLYEQMSCASHRLFIKDFDTYAVKQNLIRTIMGIGYRETKDSESDTPY